MAELRREPGLKIGIIGVGRIGHLLATFLMRYGDVYPDELLLVSMKIITVLFIEQSKNNYMRFS